MVERVIELVIIGVGKMLVFKSGESVSIFVSRGMKTIDFEAIEITFCAVVVVSKKERYCHTYPDNNKDNDDNSYW